MKLTRELKHVIENKVREYNNNFKIVVPTYAQKRMDNIEKVDKEISKLNKIKTAIQNDLTDKYPSKDSKVNGFYFRYSSLNIDENQCLNSNNIIVSLQYKNDKEAEKIVEFIMKGRFDKI